MSDEMYQRGVVEGLRLAAEAVSEYRDEVLADLRGLNTPTGNAMASIATDWLTKARGRIVYASFKADA